MKTRNWIAAGLLTAATMGAYAHESETRYCDYRLGYDVILEPGEVQLAAPGEQWRLRGDRLYRNDRELTLSDRERQQLVGYRESLERLVPDASRLAVDGAMLGLEAVNMTLAVLGDDDDADALSGRLAKISERLKAQLDGRRLPAGHVGEALIDSALENEIEDLASDAAMKIGGGITRFMFGAIFNPRAAEARGAQIERIVERRIEPRAEAIERRADALCDAIRALDAQERALGRFDLLLPDARSI